jgi:predicted PurR-regulated permease PerM
MPNWSLTPRQHYILAAALTLLGLTAIVAIHYLGFILLGQFIRYFSPVLTPLAVAGILAVMLRPYYAWLLGKVRWPSLAVALVFLSILMPLLALGWLFGSLILQQLRGLLDMLPVWIAALGQRVEQWLPQLRDVWQEQGVGEQVRQQLGAKGGWLAAQAGALIRQVASAGFGVAQMVGGLFSWVVLPVYLVFLLTSRPLHLNQIEPLIPFLKPETRADIVYLAREFVGILVAFFRGQLVIAGVQGVLYAMGFGLVGLQYGVAIGLTLGFLNIIPYLGNIIGLGVALPLAYFQADGGTGALLAVLAVFGLVQAVEAYFLTPRIMGSQTGLHPMAIIFALFFWGLAFGGLMGMILAIPLTAFLVVFWRLLKAKYLKEVV